MKPQRVLILGANGMLGHKLYMYLSEQENLSVYATVRNQDVLAKHFPFDLLKRLHSNVDARNLDSITQLVELLRPNLLINCIGLIKQSAGAQNPEANICINALLPHQLARICEQLDTRMLHISTDCVFSGKTGNYGEVDIPDASDLYGRTKLLGELNYSHCLTLRTSIIGHELQSQLGLIEWFLAQKSKIQGYTRHIFTGFPTIELARIIAHYIIPNTELNGLYHLSSEPISKYELLKLVAEKYGQDIEIEAYADTVCDRSLNSSRIRGLIHYSPPTWPEMVDRMYQDYLAGPYGKRLEAVDVASQG